MGESAGGHLVALLGTAGGKEAFPKVGGNLNVSDQVQAVADQSGPIDFATIDKQAQADSNIKKPYYVAPNDVFTHLLGVPINTDPAKDAFVSPITYISKDCPPFLILHGAKDPLVPFAQAQEMNAALQQAGVTVLLQIFPNGGHNGWPFVSGPARKVVRTFFDKYLKGSTDPVAMLSEQEAMLPPPPKKN